MATSRQCPHCGVELPGDAPAGLCPKCLLEQGMETQPAPDELGSGAAGSRAPTRFAPPRPEDLAPLFPQLEILELLGSGGMGAVYKARQPHLDRLVALKIIRPEAARDPEFAERFAREAKALARLSHPNIVTLHDFGQAGDLFYFVMEYVDGASLRELEKSGRLSPAQALAIVPQVCDALQYAHDQGVVHRDIKPENILVDKRGRVKIADFGIAKLLGAPPAEATLTASQMVLGTPHYMAPEQLERPREVDQRADIYSLGVVFYEMLTGELPLGRFQPPSRKVEVDVRLDEVVLKALEREPERRYQHASEVKTDVEQVGLAARPGVCRRTGRTRRPHAIVVAAAALAAVLSLAAYLVFRPAHKRLPDGAAVAELKSYPLDSLDGVLTRSGVELDKAVSSDGGGSLKVVAARVAGNGHPPITIRLFETGPLEVENARLTYQARLRSEGLEGTAYLEMWCRFPGLGEFFSRGLDRPLTWTTDWTSVETPFFLEKGQKPDNVSLNLVIKGKGTVWIDDLRLLKAPLR